MSEATFRVLQNFLSDFSGKLPIHELEILLEAAFHREFPDQERLKRQQLYSPEGLRGLNWLTQARLWAEKRLLTGVPIQHLTREQCFFGRYFEVGPEVLIPRPETEVMVEQILQWVLGHRDSSSLLGAEVGTGSGIIPITLALESLGTVQILATEFSQEALACAKRNANRFEVSPEVIDWIWVTQADDVLRTLTERLNRTGQGLDFLVSNPPYLVRGPHEVDSEVERFEPSEALFAPEEDSLFYYREIAEAAHRVLKPGGRLFLELPHERAQEIQSLFLDGFEGVQIISDLAGKRRVLEAKLGLWTR